MSQGTKRHNTDVPADSELKKLVAVWPKLPDPNKAAIIAIIKTVMFK